MGYGLDGQGPIPSWGKGIFSTPKWGPPSLQFNGYRGLFHWSWSGWGMKLTTHLQPVMRSRMVQLYFHSSIHLHGMVLNNWAQGQLHFYLSTEFLNLLQFMYLLASQADFMKTFSMVTKYLSQTIIVHYTRKNDGIQRLFILNTLYLFYAHKKLHKNMPKLFRFFWPQCMNTSCISPYKASFKTWH
jgi:hypothetical protein